MTVAIVQASPQSKVGFQCYGAAREFWRYREQEAILAGPYETGKTSAALMKFHCLLSKYPKSRGLMVRKSYASLIQSTVVTFEQKILPKPPGHPDCPITKYGNSKPEWYDYPNGSQMVLGGLDNAAKFLSSEFDFIYVNQAEEATLSDWETLTARASGRAGNAPYTQVSGDCNPADPYHWILHRPTLKVFYTRHEDNPALYDQETGEITERGKKTMRILDALTGVRYKRGRKGLWVSAEGQVYENYDPAVHLIDRFEIPKEWRRFRSIDFGYTNPFVCQWWAIDPDGRLILYREIYFTRRLVEDHASEILRLEAGKPLEEWSNLTRETPKERLTATRVDLARANEPIEATITDHDAEDRATLDKYGIHSIAAQKEITPGIEAVQSRLRVEADGKPRLLIMRDALVEVDPELENRRYPYCTEQEFSMYIYPKGQDGKPMKETPVDMWNHGMDGIRYIVKHIDNAYAAMRVIELEW